MKDGPEWGQEEEASGQSQEPFGRGAGAVGRDLLSGQAGCPPSTTVRNERKNAL